MRTAALLLALLATPVLADQPRYFGYAGIACGLDDPHDATTKTDYIDEVAGFTNLNQVCLDLDPGVSADRLARMAAAGATSLLNLEPVLFTEGPQGLRPNPDRATLWPLVSEAVRQSGVPLDGMIFYLVDEPTLRHLPIADLTEAAAFVTATYPAARTMVIEAYDPAGPGPIVAELDYWGFDAYGVPNPADEPLYAAYLDLVRGRLGPDQQLVLMMDAMHTPVHQDLGISPDDMAGVARSYLQLAQARGDVAAVIAYSWAGGIDNATERGVRDLPVAVQETHREIGQLIVGR
jgi:hypothetical protein